LELGAGGGLIGLAVAQECPLQNQLLVTDQLEMYELMQHNIELNNLQDKAKAMVLNWCVPLKTVFVRDFLFDRIKPQTE
jgi:tRNA1(Val) A37 N6-methylase TrmN6